MKLKYFYVDGGQNPVIGQVYHPCKVAIGDIKEVQRYQRYMADTLSFVAPTKDDCELILSYIKKIEEGVEQKIEIEGNETDLTLDKSGVQVDINVNEDWVGQPEGNFRLSELKSAVCGWQSFLSMPESFDSFVEVEL